MCNGCVQAVSQVLLPVLSLNSGTPLGLQCCNTASPISLPQHSGTLDTIVDQGDRITFISTLHGG